VKVLTTKQIIVRIAVIVAVVELLFMLALEHSKTLQGIHQSLVAPLDVAVLVGLTAPLIYVLVIRPYIVARDEALAQISHLAFTDPLTDLPNRRLLLMNLERVIASCARHGDHGALLMLDLDGFKLVNDEHGHHAGDTLLVEFARRLRSASRSENFAGRLGGDEFVVLVDRLGEDERAARDNVMRLGTKLIGLTDKPFDYGGKPLRVGASVGIRLLGREPMNNEIAIRDADTALYDSKQAGKGSAVIFGQ